MSRLKVDGVDIRELAEFTTDTILTNSNVFSYDIQAGKISGVTTSSSEFCPTTASNSYIYGGEDVSKGRIKKNGVAVSLAKIGHRPSFNNLLAEVGAGTYFLNWFEDGEVWLSTSQDSRSGTRLSTSAQKRKVFLVCLYGAGGGGGSSKWGVFRNNCGAGGGGGGLSCGCIYLTRTSDQLAIVVGSGGSSGTGGGSGGNGGISRIEILSQGFYESWIANAGSGGAGNDGSGGDGGGASIKEGTQNVCIFHKLMTATGAAGKSGSNKDTTTSTSAQAGTRYIPEGGTFTYSSGYTVSGKTNSGGDRPGGAGGCGYAGKGGQATGDGTTGRAGETSGGGSGGGAKASNNLAGGRGGDGLLRIYY